MDLKLNQGKNKAYEQNPKGFVVLNYRSRKINRAQGGVTLLQLKTWQKKETKGLAIRGKRKKERKKKRKKEMVVQEESLFFPSVLQFTNSASTMSWSIWNFNWKFQRIQTTKQNESFLNQMSSKVEMKQRVKKKPSQQLKLQPICLSENWFQYALFKSSAEEYKSKGFFGLDNYNYKPIRCYVLVWKVSHV